MHKVFNLYVFPHQFEFYVGEDEEERYRKVNGLSKDQPILSGMTCGASIYIREKDVLAIVVHEIYHAVEFICGRFNLTCEETKAYMIQYMFDQYIKWVFPERKKEKENEDNVH